MLVDQFVSKSWAASLYYQQYTKEGCFQLKKVTDNFQQSINFYKGLVELH